MVAGKLSFLVLFVGFFSACLVVKTKKMTYRNAYALTDQRIRLDGFYIHYDTDSLLDVITFFRNGYIYKTTYKDLNTARRLLNESFKVSKYGWGAFKIDQDTVKIQTFTPRGNELTAIWDVAEMHGIIRSNAMIAFNCSSQESNLKDFDCNFSFFADTIKSDGRNWLMNEK